MLNKCQQNIIDFNVNTASMILNSFKVRIMQYYCLKETLIIMHRA